MNADGRDASHWLRQMILTDMERRMSAKERSGAYSIPSWAIAKVIREQAAATKKAER